MEIPIRKSSEFLYILTTKSNALAHIDKKAEGSETPNRDIRCIFFLLDPVRSYISLYTYYIIMVYGIRVYD